MFSVGPKLELEYTLLSKYGIPSDLLPLQQKYRNGEFEVKGQDDYVRLRKTMELHQTKSQLNFVDLPLPSDVLFGKGKAMMDHSGNQDLKALVDMNFESYNKSSRKGKVFITNTILKYLQATNVRFLAKDSNGLWVEVKEDVAREKISMMFRDIRKMAQRDKLFRLTSG